MTWLVEQLVKETKGHPITLLVLLALVGYALFSYGDHASASELEAIKSQLDRDSKINECRWITDKISELQNQIYILERDAADQEWINEKKRELTRFQQRYNATTCAKSGY